MNIKNLEEKVGRIIIKFHHLERQVSILDFDFKISSFKLAQLLSKFAGLLNILHRPPMRSFNLMWAFCDILVRKQCKCDDLDDHARAISNSDSILNPEHDPLITKCQVEIETASWHFVTNRLNLLDFGTLSRGIAPLVFLSTIFKI